MSKMSLTITTTKTLIKISWRNVWRNKLRSAVVIVSIVLGIWAGMFITAMTLGLNEQRMAGAVNSYLSHVQIHNPEFIKDQNIKHELKDRTELIESISKIQGVKAFAERVISMGMISNSSGSYGIQVVGVIPESETELTTIPESLTEGTYFTEFKKNPLVIGEKLAKKLKLKYKSKVVLTLQSLTGDMVSASFRVEGIYKTSSSMFDESTLFVRSKDLTTVLGSGTIIHEIAIIGNSIENVEDIKSELSSVKTNMKIESWDEIAPELGYAQEMMSSVIYIFMGIILIALAFSIINTMLMAVLERKKELGMLMSVGMSKSKLFAMITFETIFISIVATPIGMLLSWMTIVYFGKYGIDLSAVGEGLESLGIGAVIYTYLPSYLYVNITLMTLIVALLSAVFPARRALKLNPADAVRSL